MLTSGCLRRTLAANRDSFTGLMGRRWTNPLGMTEAMVDLRKIQIAMVLERRRARFCEQVKHS